MIRFLGSGTISLLLALLIAVGARPQSMQLIHMDSPAVAAYSGPGDVVVAAAWFGLRPYSLATVGNKAVNLIRSSDSHTCDFLSSTTLGLGNSASCSTGGDNGTALATWCAATTCSVVTLYDQTGSTNCSSAACNITQATSAKRPTITLSCLGSLPCMAFVRASNQFLGESASVNAGLGNGPSFASAAKRTGNTTSFHEYFGVGKAELLFKNAVNQAGTFAGTGVYATAADSSWHAIQGFASGTASDTYVYIDGSKTTGTDTGSLTQTGVNLGCFNQSTTDCLDGNLAEAGLFDAQSSTVGWSNTQLSNMNTNIHNFWGF